MSFEIEEGSGSKEELEWVCDTCKAAAEETRKAEVEVGASSLGLVGLFVTSLVLFFSVVPHPEIFRHSLLLITAKLLAIVKFLAVQVGAVFNLLLATLFGIVDTFLKSVQ